jgi:hypothetical protein
MEYTNPDYAFKCTYCEKTIDRLLSFGLRIEVYEGKYKIVDAARCPECHKILYTALDPRPIRGEVLSALQEFENSR